MKTRLYIALIASILLVSCEDFLDVYPSKQSNQPIKTTEDLNLILNNASDYIVEYNFASVCAADNAAVDTFHYRFQPRIFTDNNALGWFLWDEYILVNAANHSNWVSEFGKIGKANLVLDFLDEVEGTVEEKNELRYEAHFIRAYSYFNLVLVYCLPYTEQNANELGLPLRTTISIEQSLARATLKETYDFIEADIQMALKTAKDERASPWRSSLPAVEAFAARFYLYLGQYDKALTHADNALKAYDNMVSFEDVMYQNGQLFNWLNLGSMYPYSRNLTTRDIYNWEEMYYLRLLYSRTFYQHAFTSQKLMDMYDPKDIRFDALFVENVRVGTALSPYVGYFFLGSGNDIPAGPTTGEMYLIKAECYARQGDIGQTMENIEAIRQNRYKAADYTPLAYPSGTKALTELVIDERNREFPFTLRWYDLHRINKDPMLDNVDITRTFYSLNGNLPNLDAPLVTYELKAGSRRYAFPITQNEIISSGGQLKQNTY
jgi:starch-binding outer membrane protein, SusD/RagB family